MRGFYSVFTAPFSAFGREVLLPGLAAFSVVVGVAGFLMGWKARRS